jgi:hypothetical protein
MPARSSSLPSSPPLSETQKSDISTGDPSGNSLTIIQLNCARSNSVFLSLFSSFSKHRPPHIVAVQEPFTILNRPLNTPGYECIYPPVPTGEVTSVAFYIHSDFLRNISYFPINFNRVDIFGITIYWNNQDLSDSPTQIELINAYNHDLSLSRISIAPHLLFRNTINQTIICGDLNIHNIYTDSLRKTNRREENLSSHYFTAAATHSYSLLTIRERFT